MSMPSGNSGGNESRLTRTPADKSAPRLTPDEIRAINECRSESFWYRCVPISALMVSGTQIMVARGIWSAHPRFGTLFKSLGACLVGFILGKVSYQGQCREKILRLENSPLADSMRKGLKIKDIPDLIPAAAVPWPEEQQVKHNQTSHLDVDTSHKQEKGLDDSNRPSLNSDNYKQKPVFSQAQQQTSYEELRRSNREGYEKRLAADPSPSPTSPGSLAPRRPQSSYASHPQPGKPLKYNEYGDVIEDTE